MQRLNINSKDFIAKTVAIVLSIVINMGVCWGLIGFSNASFKNRQNQIVVYVTSIPLSSNNDQKRLRKRTLGDNAPAKHKSIQALIRIAAQNKKLTDYRIKSNFFDITDSVNKINLIQKDAHIDETNHIEIKFNEKNNLKKPIVGYINVDNFPKIKNWIDKHKFYPMEARFEHEEGVVKIIFSVDKKRDITGIHITKKSSYEPLNKAALKIIMNSAPIPVPIVAGMNLPIHAHINIIFKLNQ